MGIEWLQHIDLNAANKHHEEPLQPWLFYTYIGISMALVTMAGLMSGLTLGLMSLDELDLEVRRPAQHPAPGQGQCCSAKASDTLSM